MLMVDVITDMDHENVETVFKVKEDNIFIDNGMLCEAGLIENAAQTCSAIVAKSFVLDENGEELPDVKLIGFISSIRSVTIHALPKAGAEITTSAVLLSKFDTGAFTTCMMKCRTFCGDELYLEGEINLFIQEQEDEKG